jgi:hypothetical protein
MGENVCAKYVREQGVAKNKDFEVEVRWKISTGHVGMRDGSRVGNETG